MRDHHIPKNLDVDDADIALPITEVYFHSSVSKQSAASSIVPQSQTNPSHALGSVSKKVTRGYIFRIGCAPGPGSSKYSEQRIGISGGSK